MIIVKAVYTKSLFTRSNLTDYQTKVCIASKFCSSSNIITALYAQFKFVVEEGVALPVDPAFWDYLISILRDIGVSWSMNKTGSMFSS